MGLSVEVTGANWAKFKVEPEPRLEAKPESGLDREGIKDEEQGRNDNELIPSFVQIGTVIRSGFGIKNGTEIRIENGMRIRIESETGSEIENETTVENECGDEIRIKTAAILHTASRLSNKYVSKARPGLKNDMFFNPGLAFDFDPISMLVFYPSPVPNLVHDVAFDPQPTPVIHSTLGRAFNSDSATSNRASTTLTIIPSRGWDICEPLKSAHVTTREEEHYPA
ncbi:hypothetical protein EVAR_37985_1 [Eumeta japonica]|uniref:Uncharacterized protein n=1 Tax=Eumeta variegata TaxID=151549 RepID=A0A4C1Z120_EUMVA|nr:hypothetical protein EVAR_37985_1 [Eumeta japonica]